MDDEPSGNINTNQSITPGGFVAGNIETAGDVDFISVHLTAGVTYQVYLAQGSQDNDPLINGIFDSSGNMIPATDDDDGGLDLDSQVFFTPTTTGVYFISVSSYDFTTGSYLLFVSVAGTPDDEIQNGNNEINFLSGLDGDDTLSGFGGVDILQGGNGNDILNGGAGPDILWGGDGIDTADFSASNGPVKVDLSEGFGEGGHAEGDILLEIEDVIGSSFNDTLYGSNPDSGSIFSRGSRLQGRSGNDVLNGGSGSDLLEGNTGADTLNGGGGFDFAGYANATTSITVNLSDDSFRTGEAVGDVLIDIQGLFGSAFNDSLTGDNNDNDLFGLEGKDSLTGLAGGDFLSGGNGNDKLWGGR